MVMKIIADGGAITKNVGTNTRDSLILALNTTYIDGVKLKLYLTKDNRIVSLGDDVVAFFTQFVNKIEDIELKKLLTYNVGTKVQKQRIITLQEVLEIFQNYKKELILELMDQGEKNALFVDLVMVAIRPYQDDQIKLKSENEELFRYLEAEQSNFQVGIVLRESSQRNWYLDASFYDIALPLLSEFNIREKTNQGKIVMLDQINRMEVFDLVYQEFQDIFESLYIITSSVSSINDSTNLNGK